MPTNTPSHTDTARTRQVRITDTQARKLRAPPSGNKIIYDRDVPGFGLRITPSGARAFILNYHFKGRERRITIGQFPTWSCGAARMQAQRLKRDVDLGIDPLENRISERNAPTVRELFERYALEHLPTKAPRSAKDDCAMWAKDILPRIGGIKVADLSPSDCDDLHRRISETRPVRANRILEVLRKALNLAIRWEWIERNPAAKCRKNPETKRHRYLQRNEVLRLVEALEAHPQRVSADALLFMLFTGCRRGEALGARWEQFDLSSRVWTKPSAETKQRREHRVPYSGSVARILDRRRAETDGPHIFPGRLGAPLREVRKTWEAACHSAGLRNVRIHDLRHTFASLVASSGHSLFVVGELLGHASTQTTKRYAALYDDPLRIAAETVAEQIHLR